MGIGSHERPNQGATDVWLTPIEIVRSLGHFDLDPCGAEGHFTAPICFFSHGLEEEWFGRVWLNPPYSEVGKWVDRLANQVDFGDVRSGIALVFARTDTKWAQNIIPRASSVFFPAGRIRFLDSSGTPGPHTSGAPSMFLSFGETPDWSLLGPGVELVNARTKD